MSSPSPSRVPPGCSLVMAKSTLMGAGLGIFTLIDRQRGHPVQLPGDVVIQLPDVMNSTGMDFFKEHYWKSADTTGGMYEGNEVHSILPGMGMLTNSIHRKANIIPYRVDRDDGDCPRETCKAAGSFTHYHNYTWFVHTNSSILRAGSELLSPQTDEWFAKRRLLRLDTNPNVNEEGLAAVPPLQHSVEWLRHHGTCVDSLQPKSSPIAGRGAFATRFLRKGSIVAPVPVIPIFDWEISLKLVTNQKSTENDSIQQRQQLLLNYCYGHPESSMLLLPYSPMVNLINHSDEPNVKLEWSTEHNRQYIWLESKISDWQDQVGEPGGLVLELVALRDILPGEEVVLDYGPHWKAAWEQHSIPSTSSKKGMMYTPAHVMDEVATKIRTQKEQLEYPYPDNLQTSCFYDFQNKTTAQNGGDGITAIPWNWTRRVFDWSNLRPCSILTRDEVSSSFYIVHMRNRKGTPPLPKRHIVAKVPRPAIRFTDKMYTTDQHLQQAFRHWIGMPDGIFPQAWRDEKQNVDQLEQHEDS